MPLNSFADLRTKLSLRPKSMIFVFFLAVAVFFYFSYVCFCYFDSGAKFTKDVVGFVLSYVLRSFYDISYGAVR